jgi:hypothetical protein
MRVRKFLQQGLALFRQVHDHLPAILRVARAHYQPALLGAVDEFDGAVVLKLQPLRQVSNRWLVLTGQPADGQQELILLRMQSPAPRCRLAEMQETAYLVAELGLGDEFRVLFAVRR